MVHNLSITYDNHSYTTNAGTLFVGRFKINGSKSFIRYGFIVAKDTKNSLRSFHTTPGFHYLCPPDKD